MSVTFLGDTVRGCDTSIGWNAGSPSPLTVRLIDDPINDLIFTPPEVGTPSISKWVGFGSAVYYRSGRRRERSKGIPHTTFA